MRLFGTTTSPYVRRVRIIARELGVPYERVDTATDAGQAELRALSPIWKVPALAIDGHVIFDSRVIIDHLIASHPGRVAPLGPNDIEAKNLVSVVDGALESLVNCLYLGRDGITSEQSPYLAKQRDRATAALEWLDRHWPSVPANLTLPDLTLTTALAWIQFRDMAPLAEYSRLRAVCEQLEARESFVATSPR